MRFIRFLTVALCLVMLLTSATPASAVMSQSQGCYSVDAAMPLDGSEKLLETSKAVVLYERNTGTLIYGYNMDQQIYPASMVKMMTTIVALENGDLDDIVTVTRSALNAVAIGSVSAHLVRGEQLRLEDLLYLNMVASANDASAVIAEHIGGSQEEFVQMMNEKAQEIGCTGTHFSNAHGLHHEQTYTTARDVLKMVEYGLKNEHFRKMFETESYVVPATELSEERKATTTNYMMNNRKYLDERVTGGKTGATDQAGRCLAVTANVGNMELVAIVMGATAVYSEDGYEVLHFGSFEEMKILLDHAQSSYECKQLFYTGQVIDRYAVGEGSDVAVTPADTLQVVLPKDVTAQELTWRYQATISGLKAPIPVGQRITDISVWYNGICLGQTDLVAMHGVEPYVQNVIPDRTEEQEEEAIGRLILMILGGILGIALMVVVGFVLFRVIQTAIIKAKIRKRRKNRRRNRNARVG